MELQLVKNIKLQDHSEIAFSRREEKSTVYIVFEFL